MVSLAFPTVHPILTMEHPVESAERARQRSRLGLTRELQTPRDTHNKKPTSGSRGVPLFRREECVEYASLYSVEAAKRKYGYSRSSIYKWMQRIDPYEMSGNKDRQNLVGLDQFLLSMSVFLFPRMQADERATFIVANGGGRAYSRQDLYKRLLELDVTRKQAGLESKNAYTPRNILRNELFWSRLPRLGIAGVRRFRLTDTDEAAFSLVKVEEKRGYAFRAHRVRDLGNYTKGSPQVNLIMTVEPGNPYLPGHVRGSVQNPRKWWRLTLGHTNQYVFSRYIDYVCSDIEDNPVPGGFDAEKYFMWDNFSVHTTAMVATTLQLRPRRNDFRFVSINRPPYRPKIAPIEYIFGEITNILSRKSARDWDQQRLLDEIHSACMEVGLEGSLDRTYLHCGYNY